MATAVTCMTMIRIATSVHLPCGVTHAGLGGLPWRTEALEEALLHLDSWSGWFHRNNGREVVRTLIAEASPTELNHMVSCMHIGLLLLPTQCVSHQTLAAAFVELNHMVHTFSLLLWSVSQALCAFSDSAAAFNEIDNVVCT